ncbi:MAG: hypothetical protein QM770_24345 [Tepidisphaeraceae bacterium]
MDVALAAHGLGVTEAFRHRFDRADDVLFRLRLAIELFELAQRLGRQYRAGESAKVLGCEILTGDFLQIRVDVVALHVAALTRFVDVLKQLLLREFLASFDNLCQWGRVDRQVVLDTMLADELHADGRALHADVAVLDRGQAEAFVAAGVFVVAHTGERLLQQRDDSGQHLLARQAFQLQVAVHGSAQARKCLREVDDAFVLRFVAGGAEVRVIAGLLSAPRVATGRLQVAGRSRADPDIGPRRRNDQRLDAGERGGVRDAPAGAGVDVVEALAVTFAG